MSVPNLPTENVSIVIDKLFSPTIRFALYVVAFVTIAVLVILGLISEGQAAMWLFFAGSILGIGTSGLAVLNHPKKVS